MKLAERCADAPAAQRCKEALGPAAAFVGGGTALQLAWMEGAPPGLTLVDVNHLPQAQGIDIRRGVLRIGAAVRLEAVRTDARVRQFAPLLAQACDGLAALSVRHLATLGGNVGWRFGDTLAALLAMGAQAELADGQQVPLDGLMSRPELPLVVALHVDGGRLPRIAFYEKVGRRAAFSPSRLALAVCADPGPPGGAGLLQNLRIGASGAGLRGRRLRAAERCLSGPGGATLREACAHDLPEDVAIARLAARLLAGHLDL